jgi:hypothetical protein
LSISAAGIPFFILSFLSFNFNTTPLSRAALYSLHISQNLLLNREKNNDKIFILITQREGGAANENKDKKK